MHSGFNHSTTFSDVHIISKVCRSPLMWNLGGGVDNVVDTYKMMLPLKFYCDQHLPRIFFLKRRIACLARLHCFHSLGQNQFTVAQRAGTTVAECFLTSCVCARFLIGSHATPGQRHSQPAPTSLGHCICMFRCNLLPALLAEWPRSFSCHCGNTGVERTPN